MSNRCGFIGLFLTLTLWAGLLSAAAEDPVQVVQETADRVLTEVKDHKTELEATPAEVYELVDQIILPRFDFNRISRLVLGKYWRRASPEQRERFIREFQELLIRTYAMALLNYSDQQITYLPLRRVEGAVKATVNTKVSSAGSPQVPIDYKLYLSDDEWKVYDVTIDGVSLVSTYRSSFASQIRRFKMDGLLERMSKMNKREM